MAVAFGVALGLLLFAAVCVIAQLFWRHHQPHLRESCETCGASLKPKDVHHVTSAFAVDSWEIGGGGGASITATFCEKDCVGSCDKEHSYA